MYIRIKFIFMFLTIYNVQAWAAAYDFCDLHWNELNYIQNTASCCLCDAHRLGGELFRPSIFSISSSATYFARSCSDYVQFSNLFLDFMSYCKPKGLKTLHDGYSTITDLFLEMHTRCILNHKNTFSAHYERGRIYFDRGLYAESLLDIQSIVDSENWESFSNNNKENEPTLFQGQTLLETCSYVEAINVLSKLIKKDPTNKEAYFYRASAYFETGLFDEAISDYLNSEMSSFLTKVESKVSNQFRDALLTGLVQGGLDEQ